MIIKNLKKYFTFEVQVPNTPPNKTRQVVLFAPCRCYLFSISAVSHYTPAVWPVYGAVSQSHSFFFSQVLDDKNVRRRFRASNYQSTTRVKPFICTMPMRLDDGWNQIQFNLSDFTRRAYGTNYIETLRVQVRAEHEAKRLRYESNTQNSSMHVSLIRCFLFYSIHGGHFYPQQFPTLPTMQLDPILIVVSGGWDLTLTSSQPEEMRTALVI